MDNFLQKIILSVCLPLLIAAGPRITGFIGVPAGGGQAEWLTEDFNDYTEVDPGNTITVTSTTIDAEFTDTRNTTTYVVIDKGVDYFSGDFEVRFEVYINSTYSSAQAVISAMWNEQNDAYTIKDGGAEADDGWSIVTYRSGATRYFTLQVWEDGTETEDNYSSFSEDTLYYFKVVRDDDGGANSTGKYTVTICTGSHECGSPVDTLTVDSGAGEQNDFRYLYGYQSYNSSTADTLWDGYVQNLQIYE